MTSTPSPAPPEPDLVEAYLELDPVSVCSRLTAALKDAAHGWRVAADEVEAELAESMRNVGRRREQFAVELSNVVSGRSGHVTDAGTVSGHLLTWWLQIRAMTSRDTTTAVLHVCESGSKALRSEYHHALDTALPDPIRDLIVRQLDDIDETSRWIEEALAERT